MPQIHQRQDKPLTKQEWSDEQIKKDLDKAANEWEDKASFSPIAMVMDGDRPIGITQHITSHADSFKAGVDWIIKKLKDSPQSQWKPSENQIDALDRLIRYEQRNLSDNIILNELKEQLKKLMEE